MKFSVFYFSGTGNTRWAVNELSNKINKMNHECKTYSIENGIVNLQEIIENTDIVGFAFPIYGADMPSITKDFILKFKNLLNPTHKKQCFVITTAGFIDAYGPFAARKMLKPYGLQLVGYINIAMSNNISTPKMKAKFISREKLKERMNKGKAEMQELVFSIVNEKKHIRNIGFYLLPGIIIRKASKNGKKNNYKALSVDSEKCIKCMTCINNCPTNSIVFSNNEFIFLPSCTACMRCYNMCPKYAVLHQGQYADPSIFKRYKGPEAL